MCCIRTAQQSKTNILIKLVIVEDDGDLREMVTRVLRMRGMEIKGLASGKLLLESLTIERPDIVLMDIYLGDSDGRTLCKQLKNSQEYSAIPIVLYSAGNISNTSIVDSLADDFVQKPFNLSSLFNCIQKNLIKRRGSQ